MAADRPKLPAGFAPVATPPAVREKRKAVLGTGARSQGGVRTHARESGESRWPVVDRAVTPSDSPCSETRWIRKRSLAQNVIETRTINSAVLMRLVSVVRSSGRRAARAGRAVSCLVVALL